MQQTTTRKHTRKRGLQGGRGRSVPWLGWILFLVGVTLRSLDGSFGDGLSQLWRGSRTRGRFIISVEEVSCSVIVCLLLDLLDLFALLFTKCHEGLLCGCPDVSLEEQV